MRAKRNRESEREWEKGREIERVIGTADWGGDITARGRIRSKKRRIVRESVWLEKWNTECQTWEGKTNEKEVGRREVGKRKQKDTRKKESSHFICMGSEERTGTSSEHPNIFCIQIKSHRDIAITVKNHHSVIWVWATVREREWGERAHLGHLSIALCSISLLCSMRSLFAKRERMRERGIVCFNQLCALRVLLCCWCCQGDSALI